MKPFNLPPIAIFVLCAATAAAVHAQTLTTLASFDGTNGAGPIAGLVQGAGGRLYGTTIGGGTAFEGTVFEIDPMGKLTTLQNFCAKQSRGCKDGAGPYAGLIQATDGDLYGTTEEGGGAACAIGCGTIFKITPSGSRTTLHSFCADGCGHRPNGLIQATDGSFYGTTLYGGSRYSGTVFKIDSNGTFTTLYSFCSETGCTDGAYPNASLIQATDGDFYGTTETGGANCAPDGCGTVFKITPGGALTTLYSFCAQSGCPDGQFSTAALVQAANGDFYGTTLGGGANDCTAVSDGCGTIFKITSGGKLTTLYSFCSLANCADGTTPFAGLVQAANGNFYGTTEWGGAHGAAAGTVFEVTPGGTLTTLYSFCSQAGCTDGESPYAGLIQSDNGVFYGTTYLGGANGEGTVFSLSVDSGASFHSVSFR
jgi:uncharacterized repeat protein (TIGR03803 family)